MPRFPSPTVETTDGTRLLQCRSVVEKPIKDLVTAAVEAGWNEEEVLSAIAECADDLLFASVHLRKHDFKH